MSAPRVIEATYSTWRPVQGRKVLQLVFEVPLERQGEVLQMLGVPDEKWCAIAVLDTATRAASAANTNTQDAAAPLAPKPPRESSKPKRAFSDMSLSQQSGIRANDWRFQDFLEHEYAGVWRNLKDAAASIREICGVQSRSELATDHNAANKWRTLNSKFESWLADQLYAESVRR